MRKILVLLFSFTSLTSIGQTNYFNNITGRFSTGVSILLKDSTFILVSNDVNDTTGLYQIRNYEFSLDSGKVLSTIAFPDSFSNTLPYLNAICRLSNNTFVIAANTSYLSPISRGYGTLVKFDNQMNMIWKKDYPDWDSVRPSDVEKKYISMLNEVKALPNGDLVATGQYYRGSGYDFDGFVMRTDSSGNLIWKSTFGNPNDWASVYNIEIIDSSSFYLIGHWECSGVNIAKFDLNGNKLWQNTHFIFDTIREVYASCVTSDGNIVFSNTKLYNGEYDLHYFRLSKVTPVDGSIIWTKTLRVDVDNTIYGVRELEDSSLVIFGYTWYENIYDPSLDNYYGLLVKTTKDGDSLWTRRISRNPLDRNKLFFDLVTTQDKGFLATGYILDYDTNWTTTWIVKMDSLGCTDPNCLDTLIGSNQMVEFRGLPVVVYPNPASRELVVGFNTQGKAIGLVEVFDMAGKLLISHKANSPSIKLNVSGLEPGLHIIRLTDIEGQTWQEKFVKE